MTCYDICSTDIKYRLALEYLNYKMMHILVFVSEARKRVKYSLLSRSHHFVLVANETSGALGPNALSLFIA